MMWEVNRIFRYIILEKIVTHPPNQVPQSTTATFPTPFCLSLAPCSLSLAALHDLTGCGIALLLSIQILLDPGLVAIVVSPGVLQLLGEVCAALLDLDAVIGLELGGRVAS